MRRRLLPPALIAGILWIPAIGASAQILPPLTTTTTDSTTTTTTTEPGDETTTTTEAEGATTTTEVTTTTEPPEDEPVVASSLTGGSLSISAPASAVLPPGTAAAGTLESQLGEVTVTDARGAVGASWTATVAATSFTTGGGSAAETIGRERISYWSGAATDVDGVGTFAPGQPLAANAQTLNVSRTAFRLVSSTGDTSATWNPTIIVSIPSSAIAGTYQGTITHSVA